MKIRPLDRSASLPARVAQELMREILEGRFEPGGRLPTEQSLAETFGVSRNVVREAISRLRGDGLVHSRQGVGAFVAENAASATLRIDTQDLGEPATFLKLFELRAVLEIAAAEMAATRRTEDDLREIEALLERLRQADEWRAEGVDVDLAMHRAIARASHNDYVAVFVSFLSEHMRRSIMAARQRNALAAIVEVTIAEHAAIVDAVRARDAEAAGRSMRDHIVNAAARIGLPRLVVPRPDAPAPAETDFAAVTRN
jgi:GntR family transcriptional regulator, transcriptional repressor for pyruvate dehydrogenase complex